MILAIVQARMSSSRLPGKVLKTVLGKPMIQHLLERLSMSKKIDKVVVATSVDAESDPLHDFVKSIGFDVYRGSEEDVLDRFYQAAKKYQPQTVVRITGDSPLLDPAICDGAIGVYEKDKVDYVHTGPTFAEGLDCEVLSFKSLEVAWKESKLKSEREHVTQYLHKHPELFKKITLGNKTDDSKYRFTLDEEEDFIVIKTILEEFARKGKPHFTAEDIKSFLDNRRDIYEINAHIVRNEGLLKSLKEDQVVKK
ncbi:MAG: glycosyltransferase family protein [Candidatus Omnitrophica bacterium]|nr:glycosyltransferase family protein [Candidatus Omnitrophota bacterium]